MSSLQDFNRLKEKVLIKRPILQSILQKQGNKKLLDYADEYVNVNLNPTIQRRQDEFLGTFYREVTRRLGADIAASAVKQLEKHYFVSTADHLGPITHPFFINSNLLTAAPYLDKQDPSLNNIIVLACSNISVDNLSFPRGLIFHNYKNDQLQLHRLAFFSANTRPPVVHNLRAYTIQEVDKIKHLLQVKLQKGEIDQREVDILDNLFNEIYSKPEILECESYSDQISKTNYQLWKKFFPLNTSVSSNLIYLELESLVVKLLVDHHLYQDTIINHILFDSSYESLINSYFEGIFGSFSREEKSGTYLFWALPKGSRYVLQLWRKGNFLVSKDESYKIELNPEVIKKAMEEKELIPGLMLNFMTVSFYYGLKCLGGFNQVNYLTFMKNGYIKMNTDLGNYRSIEVCARAQTKELCDGLSLAFLQYGQKELALATGLDLILYGDKDTWSRFLETAKNITFEEALNPLMPEIYKISYPNTEWENDLLAITDKDIIDFTELNKKIRPCLTI